MSTTIDVKEVADPQRLATQIDTFFRDWDNYRESWLQDQEEKTKYIHATSTKQTGVGSATPWKNNTTLPKLTQIRDNLHANYMATLFPNSNWLTFEGLDQASETKDKKKASIAYIKHKWNQAKQRETISHLVLDWIDYGNCFAMPVYVDETVELEDGEILPGYVGPKLVRISPYDIVFNPLAPSFEETPKIIRSVKSIGELKKDIETKPEMSYLKGAFEEIIKKRRSVQAKVQINKNNILHNQGFGGIDQYYDSQYIEILDFYGDIYDEETGELLKNYCISIADRSVVIRKKPNPSWLGKTPIYHSGWRNRADNLYSQGPLDNLVGMQFMIDKLQNAKADIMDQVIHPILKVKGQVEDFEWMPGERIYEGDDGSVDILRVDATYVTVSNNEILLLQNQMEEMAGAPKQAAGIRTPGEKTKFEVQTLERATNRIFLHRTSHFEEVFLEPLINAMLEMARRNMDMAETIRMESDKFSSVLFKSISKEDLSTKGTLRPFGARRFAEQANRLQEYLQLVNAASGNPIISKHLVGKKIAQNLFEIAGFDNTTDIVRENASVIEQVDAETTAQMARQVAAEQMANGQINEEDAVFADESLMPKQEQLL